MAEYRIVKLDWDNANNDINVVLISKRDREMLQCELHSGVFCKHGTDKKIALVEMQFREFVGQENVCTINAKLASEIHAAIGDIIEIDAGVTESEWAAFERTIPRRSVSPAQMLRAILGNGHRDADNVGRHE